MPCKKCGECCKWIYISIDPTCIIDEIIPLRKGVEIIESNIIRIYAPCKYLENNLCYNYDNRPQACKDFPNEKSAIPKECKFEEKGEEDDSDKESTN